MNLLLTAFIGIAPRAFAAPAARFRSPLGRFDVVFTEVSRSTFSAAQTDADHVDSILYSVEVSRPEDGVLIASAAYNDVYGARSGRAPAPAAELFREILWSPREDFLVLPGELWPLPPETLERTALALASALKWKKSIFKLDDVHWLDSLRAAGDQASDCDLGVYLFDGLEGTARPLKESESPAGFALVSVTGGSALIRRFPDHCATVGTTFRASCLTLNLKTLEEASSPCRGN